jgi:hypothetical protein
MKTTILAAAVLGMASAAASATQYQWIFDGSNPGQNPAGGTISAVNSTFDTASKVFTWDVSFSDGVSGNTNGYWLVVNDGPNPKSHDRELAIMYFDATSLAAPKVSIYRYNGANSNNSFSSPGDLLASSSVETSGIAASVSDSGDTRTMRLMVDATSINSRYGAANGFPDWEGIAFDDRIGMWFHPIRNAHFGYDGLRITSLGGTSGWLDGDHLTTTIIPAPGAAALVAMGGLLATRRRRSAN